MSHSMNSLLVLIGVRVLTAVPILAATDCASLKSVSVPYATITMAEMVSAGALGASSC